MAKHVCRKEFPVKQDCPRWRLHGDTPRPDCARILEQNQTPPCEWLPAPGAGPRRTARWRTARMFPSRSFFLSVSGRCRAFCPTAESGACQWQLPSRRRTAVPDHGHIHLQAHRSGKTVHQIVLVRLGKNAIEPFVSRGGAVVGLRTIPSIRPRTAEATSRPRSQASLPTACHGWSRPARMSRLPCQIP